MRQSIALLVLCAACHGSLGAVPSGSGTTTRAASFADARLAAFRAQLEATPCLLGIVASGETVDIDQGPPVPPAKPSDCTRYATLDAFRTDFIALPVPYAAFSSAVEAMLRPLAHHEFGFYSPFGRNRRRHDGVEYLLRDGRTVLGIVHRRSAGKNVPDAVLLSIFDVRGLPPTWSHLREGGFAEEDRYRYGVALNPAPYKHMRMWAGTIGLGRAFQTAALDPERAPGIALEPELQAMGESLARLRWQRMDDMVTAFLPMQRDVDDKGNRAAAQLRADNRRREALVNPPGDRNWLAKGILDGLDSAARTQQFWNARAAEAQARYFRAQHGGRRSRPDGDGRGNASPARPAPAATPAAPQAAPPVASRPLAPAPAPPAAPRCVTVQRSADGNSHALLKKDELGPAQEQEACAAAREQANLNHALDGEEKTSIRFGACGACKPTQWVFGAPNGSSWKMTCTVDYSVDVKQSQPGNGSSSSR